jgi:hypothetical protein
VELSDLLKADALTIHAQRDYSTPEWMGKKGETFRPGPQVRGTGGTHLFVVWGYERQMQVLVRLPRMWRAPLGMTRLVVRGSPRSSSARDPSASSGQALGHPAPWALFYRPPKRAARRVVRCFPRLAPWGYRLLPATRAAPARDSKGARQEGG